MRVRVPVFTSFLYVLSSFVRLSIFIWPCIRQVLGERERETNGCIYIKWSDRASIFHSFYTKTTTKTLSCHRSHRSHSHIEPFLSAFLCCLERFHPHGSRPAKIAWLLSTTLTNKLEIYLINHSLGEHFYFVQLSCLCWLPFFFPPIF